MKITNCLSFSPFFGLLFFFTFFNVFLLCLAMSNTYITFSMSRSFWIKVLFFVYKGNTWKSLNPLMSGGNKKVKLTKQTCSFQLSVCVTFLLPQALGLKVTSSNEGNSFQTNALFLYPLKTSENQKCSEFFRGYRKGTLAWNGLMIFQVI